MWGSLFYAVECLVSIGRAQLLTNAETVCAVKRRWSTAGVNLPGNWFAPPGSNQSSSGGNETAEASGAEGREGDLASMQAVR